MGMAIQFSSNALHKSQEIRARAVVLQDKLRHDSGTGKLLTQEEYAFQAVSADGSTQEETVLFKVQVKPAAHEIQADQENTVTFYRLNPAG